MSAARPPAARYTALDPAEWYRDRPRNWTLRQIAGHLIELDWYAAQVGDLGRTASTH